MTLHTCGIYPQLNPQRFPDTLERRIAMRLSGNYSYHPDCNPELIDYRTEEQ